MARVCNIIVQLVKENKDQIVSKYHIINFIFSIVGAKDHNDMLELVLLVNLQTLSINKSNLLLT